MNMREYEFGFIATTKLCQIQCVLLTSIPLTQKSLYGTPSEHDSPVCDVENAKKLYGLCVTQFVTLWELSLALPALFFAFALAPVALYSFALSFGSLRCMVEGHATNRKRWERKIIEMGAWKMIRSISSLPQETTHNKRDEFENRDGQNFVIQFCTSYISQLLGLSPYVLKDTKETVNEREGGGDRGREWKLTKGSVNKFNAYVIHTVGIFCTYIYININTCYICERDSR